MSEKLTSCQIKYALMSYFRFTRQWICASECMDNDVMVLGNKGIIEVEVKVSKYDLWKGEARKPKHARWKEESSRYYRPNKFYICTEKHLIEEATKWVEETNSKYGIIEAFEHSVYIRKKAVLLHKNISPYIPQKIMMRVCSENIGLMGRMIREEIK